MAVISRLYMIKKKRRKKNKIREVIRNYVHCDFSMRRRKTVPISDGTKICLYKFNTDEKKIKTLSRH